MTDRNEHADLGQLLEDAVAGVEPRPGLAEIRRRTAEPVPTRRRSWMWGAGGAVLATAATVAAFAVAANTTDTPDGGEDRTPVLAQSKRAVPVYYLGSTEQGPRLYREFHRMPVADRDELMLAAVDEAVSGQPLDPDYHTRWPRGTRAQSVRLVGDVLTVSLSSPDVDLVRRPRGMSAAVAAMAVEQVIYSAQAGLGQGRPPVQLLVGGERVHRLLGVPVSEPLAAGDPLEVWAATWIISPGSLQTVTSGFTVQGVSAAFEATVTWELLEGTRVVKSGFATAEECCTHSPYSFSVKAPPGQYLLVVRGGEASDEGFRSPADTKRITVE